MGPWTDKVAIMKTVRMLVLIGTIVPIGVTVAADPSLRTTDRREGRPPVPASLCMGDTAPPTPDRTGARATITQLSWLSGVWVRPDGSDERWTPAAGGSMIGVSRTLRNGVLAEFEFLCIVQRDGGLVYQAMPNGRSPATDFRMTRIDENSVTFENPKHDFPKMIRYSRRADGALDAVVSAGDRSITFTFTRQQP